MEWSGVLILILGAIFIWLIYRSVRNKPELFSASNLSKSLMTMGMLALILIAFIALLIVAT